MKITIRIETDREINVDKVFSYCKDAIQYTESYNCVYLLDDDRNIIGTIDIDKRQSNITITETSSGFTTYDTSQGGCAFCGKVGCFQQCMGGQ